MHLVVSRAHVHRAVGHLLFADHWREIWVREEQVQIKFRVSTKVKLIGWGFKITFPRI